MALCSLLGDCFVVASAAPAVGQPPALRALAPPAVGQPLALRALAPEARPAAGGLALGSPYPATACALAAAAGAVSVAGSRRRNVKKPAEATIVHAFENELGVQPPTGFWDPAGYTADGDAAEFYRRRCVEIKHGRVSMLACIGYIVPEYFKWPGYISPSDGIKFTDIPHGLAAITRVPAVGWTQVVFFGLSMELFAAYQDPEKPPGKLSSRLVIGLTEIKNKSLAGGVNNQGYEFGPFGIPGAPSIADPELRKRKLNAEIANGRLAMVAIMGMMFQNGTVGTTGPEMWLGASAMPEALKGTGGPMPDDVWDPLGLSVGKSEEQLLYWRAVEVKHGRVAMLAVLGWFHVVTGWHPIGDLAARMKVSDDPLINVTQLPIGGAFQVVFTIMVLEWATTYVCPPPKDEPWDVLGFSPLVAFKEDGNWKTQQLQELNNGRLAMVAFIGLVAQDVVTGNPGPPLEIVGNFDLTADGLLQGAPMPRSPGVIGAQPLYPPVGFIK